MSQQYLYDFNEAPLNAVNLLGAKGHSLAIMNTLKMPVPPGFIISTDVYRIWHSNGNHLPDDITQRIEAYIHRLEMATNTQLGNPDRPLIVSVRSGAATSMPGMMSTILNLGITADMLEPWANAINESAFAYSTYCRFLINYSIHVLDIPREQLSDLETSVISNASDMRRLSRDWADRISVFAGRAIPSDPFEQVAEAINVIFRSWNSSGAIAYRQEHLIPDDLGTAAVVQTMVFGNRSKHSGSGVAYTRNLTTGAKELDGTYLLSAQGEEIVGGRAFSVPKPIMQLKEDFPDIYDRLEEYSRKLEMHFKWPQDIEFTIENGELWLLQTRRAPLVAEAAIKVAVALVREGLLTQEQAVYEVPPDAVRFASKPQFTLDALEQAFQQKRLLLKGLGASSGLAVGPLVIQLASDSVRLDDSQAIIVRDLLEPAHDVNLMQRAQAFITILGGTSSHAATLARKLRKPYIAGCKGIEIDKTGRKVHFGSIALDEGTIISVDGSSGNIFLGEVTTLLSSPFPELSIFAAWERVIRTQSTWEVACYPDRESNRDFLLEAKGMLNSLHWRTDKAKAIELMQLIPAEYRITQIVVDAKDKERIRQLMVEGIKEGFWIGPKCCYSKTPRLGKGLWQMGIQTHEQVEDFLNNPYFPGLSPNGGYPRWIEDENLEEIVIVYDPPYKGIPEYAYKQFIFTVSCTRDPGTVQIEMSLGTAKIRLLETAQQDQLIHISMKLDYYAPRYHGHRALVFGQSYFKPGILTRLKENIAGKGRSNQQEDNSFIALCAILASELNDDHSHFDEELIGSCVVQAMQKGKITDEMLEVLIEPSVLRTVRRVEEIVFGVWWIPPFELPYLMRALDAIYDLETLEFQGSRTSEGEPEYMLLFDAKGHEEVLSL